MVPIKIFSITNEGQQPVFRQDCGVFRFSSGEPMLRPNWPELGIWPTLRMSDVWNCALASIRTLDWGCNRSIWTTGIVYPCRGFAPLSINIRCGHLRYL